jgi:putative peptide zinc metalloprotease protein
MSTATDASELQAGAEGPATGRGAPVPLDVVPTVCPLSIVPDGEEFLVGDPARSEYVLLPELGIRVIRLLQAGHTVGEAAAEIGADVDVPDFVASLIELGFVSPTPAPQAENDVARPVHRAAQRIRPGLVRPLFGRVAWTLYAGCAALVMAIFATQPELVPRSGDIFFLPSPLVSVACVTLLTFLLACIHECCHWAAARAEGLDARMTVSRRLYLLAFETDLSQLWSVPRHRRYSALLAGMAFDSVVLCGALLLQLSDAKGWWQLESGTTRLLAAIAFVELGAIVVQFCVFMRTDLYAVLITATGCVNLWRVNQLRLTSKLRRLSAEEWHELNTAHPQDLAVARWYVWLYAAGLALAIGFFFVYYLPATAHLVSWLAQVVLVAEVSTVEFWGALLFALIVLSPYALTLAVTTREVVRHRV